MNSDRATATRNSGEKGDDALAIRWLLRGVAMMVVAALLLWAVWLVWDPKSFPLRSVRIVSPLVHVSAEQVRTTVLPFAADGFLRVDMEGLRSELQALPWVYRASLRRAWPDVLEVSLVEQVPVARWEAGGLVNEHGELFKPENDGEQPQLPLFAGPTETAAALVERYGQLAPLLQPLQLTVDRLAVSERRAWDVALSNGLHLALGRSDAVARMERLVRVYPQTLAPRLAEIERVDLRYTNGFAVRWRAGKAPAV